MGLFVNGYRRGKTRIVTFAMLALILPLWLFTEDLDVPVVTLTKVGLVLMCVGGALVALGLFQRSREST